MIRWENGQILASFGALRQRIAERQSPSWRASFAASVLAVSRCVTDYKQPADFMPRLTGPLP